MTSCGRVASFLLVALSLTATAAGEKITTGTLVREMIDMHRLAEFPSPTFRTVQYSSFDRRSSVPGGPDWFANSDGFGGEPIPNFEAVLREPGDDGTGEYLICDVQGPGAIVRCWTARIGGTIRMYLDEAKAPVYDGAAEDFLRHPFNVLADRAGVDPTIYEETFNQQNATYCPMPFAERCRIIWVGNLKESHFYEVQLRLYEAGAEVVTFRPNDLRTYRKEMEEVATVLKAPGAQWKHRSKEANARPILATVDPGESVELLRLEGGPGALERLTLRARSDEVDYALRRTVLNIHCDGAPWGHVQSPLGDFFGAAPGVNPLDSVPFTVTPDGTMTSRFVMPYRESLVIKVENRDGRPVTIIGSALPATYEWTDRSMHFRARWRIDHDILADPRAVRDIPFLMASGTGRYVGTTSLLFNPTDIPTPYGGWWGEGDEKIFVDADRFPSTFGTGSEDYYNYAWSIPDLFDWAYCGQPRNDGPGNRGFVTNYRYHILDSLPFGERIAFYMELYPHGPTPGFSYGRLAYHYGRPELVDDHQPIRDVELIDLVLPPDWVPGTGWGAGNSVYHEPEILLSGADEPEVGFNEDNLFSSGRLMTWYPQRKGGVIHFDVPIEEDGNYVVDLCVARGRSGGKIDVFLGDRTKPDSWSDGKTASADLKAPGPTHLRRVQTSELQLQRGLYELVLMNMSDGDVEIGIDFIWVQKK